MKEPHRDRSSQRQQPSLGRYHDAGTGKYLAQHHHRCKSPIAVEPLTCPEESKPALAGDSQGQTASKSGQFLRQVWSTRSLLHKKPTLRLYPMPTSSAASCWASQRTPSRVSSGGTRSPVTQEPVVLTGLSVTDPGPLHSPLNQYTGHKSGAGANHFIKVTTQVCIFNFTPK